MNIFFDLDGTLIDSKNRLYKLFSHLVPQSNYSFNEYWGLKKNKISHKEILVNFFKYTEDDFILFQKNWMASIEQDEWLSLDKPFEGVTEYLHKLKQKHQLFVVTARQYDSVAIKQIELLGCSNIFVKIFVTGQKIEKFDLISNTMKVSGKDWFVGDTGKDIQTGKLLGINTAAVLTGFLNEEVLKSYKPDLIVNSVLNLPF